jgi:hypothetical protein
MEKDKKLIPLGVYCYRPDYLYIGEEREPWEFPIVYCPYYTHKEINGVSVPYCSYLEKLGWSNSWKDDEEWKKLIEHFGSESKTLDALELDLLWDACKECGENDEEDFGIDMETEEGRNQIDEIDMLWLIEVKGLADKK